jgi:hypothetical protein
LLAVLLGFFFFEDHVAVLDGVEDLSAELAFDEFGVFVARDRAYLRMPALLESGLERRNERIFTRHRGGVNGDSMNSCGICGFLGRSFGLRGGRRSALASALAAPEKVDGTQTRELVVAPPGDSLYTLSKIETVLDRYGIAPLGYRNGERLGFDDLIWDGSPVAITLARRRRQVWQGKRFPCCDSPRRRITA